MPMNGVRLRRNQPVETLATLLGFVGSQSAMSTLAYALANIPHLGRIEFIFIVTDLHATQEIVADIS